MGGFERTAWRLFLVFFVANLWECGSKTQSSARHLSDLKSYSSYIASLSSVKNFDLLCERKVVILADASCPICVEDVLRVMKIFNNINIRYVFSLNRTKLNYATFFRKGEDTLRYVIMDYSDGVFKRGLVANRPVFLYTIDGEVVQGDILTNDSYDLIAQKVVNFAFGN